MAKRKDSLQVVLCVPGRYYPASDKNIVAQVKDGNRTQYFTFGPSHSLRSLYEQCARVYSDPKCRGGWRKTC